MPARPSLAVEAALDMMHAEFEALARATGRSVEDVREATRARLLREVAAVPTAPAAAPARGKPKREAKPRAPRIESVAMPERQQHVLFAVAVLSREAPEGATPALVASLVNATGFDLKRDDPKHRAHAALQSLQGLVKRELVALAAKPWRATLTPAGDALVVQDRARLDAYRKAFAGLDRARGTGVGEE